jgi:hypothetical protein
VAITAARDRAWDVRQAGCLGASVLQCFTVQTDGCDAVRMARLRYGVRLAQAIYSRSRVEGVQEGRAGLLRNAFQGQRRTGGHKQQRLKRGDSTRRQHEEAASRVEDGIEALRGAASTPDECWQRSWTERGSCPQPSRAACWPALPPILKDD